MAAKPNSRPRTHNGCHSDLWINQSRIDGVLMGWLSEPQWRTNYVKNASRTNTTCILLGGAMRTSLLNWVRLFLFQATVSPPPFFYLLFDSSEIKHFENNWSLVVNFIKFVIIFTPSVSSQSLSCWSWAEALGDGRTQWTWRWAPGLYPKKFQHVLLKDARCRDWMSCLKNFRAGWCSSCRVNSQPQPQSPTLHSSLVTLSGLCGMGYFFCVNKSVSCAF